MDTGKINRLIAASIMILIAALPSIATAHCDTLDGPVVTDARIALEKSDIAPVLKWIQKEDEEQIKNAFKKTLAVRTKGAEAKDLADMYFFETLVRIHRAGEGAPYTGLKAAGSQLNPAVAAADNAIEKGNVNELIEFINNAAEKGLKDRFHEVMQAKKNAEKDAEEGRKYVAAYVEFVHYSERLYDDAAVKAAHQHNDHDTQTSKTISEHKDHNCGAK